MYRTFSTTVQLTLKETAELLVQKGKGILAADESPSSIVKRFQAIHVENTAEQRRIYRQLLFSTPNIQRYISGIILHEETFNQSNDSSVCFPAMLTQMGILPGIKLDKGLESLTIHTNETITLGFDDLEKRCEDFYSRGARFAKWRCVFRINKIQAQPSEVALINNAIALARFASICQTKSLVPIIESDILTDGNHDIELCQEVTEKVLITIFKTLSDYDVYHEGCLLKINMVTPGRESKKKVKPTDVALSTITALNRTCPTALAGIMFLSGGQSEDEATLRLNEINRSIYKSKCPWPLTFGYGRALQASALRSWSGKRENELNAQENFLKRLIANVAALNGEYIEKNSNNEAE